MNKLMVIQKILNDKLDLPSRESGTFFAPSNIALCKYWGKRNTELNLPQTSSFSVSLGNFGAKTTIKPSLTESHQIYLNGQEVEPKATFAKNIISFLALFRGIPSCSYKIMTEMNIPMGAGLASSACGYAALVGALDQLYAWQLPAEMLSVLARLGSGSACRSFWQGFVEWQRGNKQDGMDSFGIPYPETWKELRIGLLILNPATKKLSSRIAMENTVTTSPYYAAWPKKHGIDDAAIKEAIKIKDFVAFGEAIESNALAMHALMLTSNPAILYSEAATIGAIHKIWEYRSQGLGLYFTQDAGPNLKLVFLAKDQLWVQKLFPGLQIVAPFESMDNEDTL